MICVKTSLKIGMVANKLNIRKFPLKVITTICVLVCSSVLTYLVYKEVLRYRKNEDASTIAFKKFNASHRDKYPVFTLCYKGSSQNQNNFQNAKSIYTKTYRKYNRLKNYYWPIITGRRNATANGIKNLVNFSLVTIKPEKLMVKFSTVDGNDQTIESWRLNDTRHLPSDTNQLISVFNSSVWPFHISYQTPNQICYTREVRYKKNFLKLKDHVHLHFGKLRQLMGKSKISVFVHQEGQLLRSFGEQVLDISLYEEGIDSDIFKQWIVKISGVNVIRKRVDGTVTCDANMDNQDTVFQQTVMKNVGCIPPYWKPLFSESKLGLSHCVSSDQLKTAYEYSKHPKLGDLLNNLTAPCTEMTISSSIEMRGKAWN